MAAVAVAPPLPIMRASDTWPFRTSDHDQLAELRLSLLDRGQSENADMTRRKRTGSSRNRHSWRWSWKQMLTKPFQNQSWSRGGSPREKGKRKKRNSSQGFQNGTKNSVETRKKMDELYRIWLCEADNTSEESSDDDYSERDRRRSCLPRVFASDSSSSDDDTDSNEEDEVSQYVKEGPSRIVVDIIPEDVGIIEDLGGISDSSTQTSDSETDVKVTDLYNLNMEPKTHPNSLKRNTEIVTVSQPGAKTDYTKAVTECHDMNTNDRFPSSQAGSSEGGESSHDRADPGAMTSTRGMTNNCRNERVITQTQIFHQDILKRVEELCAQCGNEVYERKTNLESSSEETDIHHGPTKTLRQEEGIKKQDFDGFDLDSPQGGYLKETTEERANDVVPDYPSSYPKTGTQQISQMSSQNEEQYSKLQCEFKRFGCNFLGTNMAAQLEQHMQSSLNDHLKLVSKIAQDQKEQLQNQQLEQQKQSLLIQQLTDTVNNFEKLVKEQSQATQSQEKTTHVLKDQIKDQRKQNQRFEREITNQIQALSQSPTSSLDNCAAEFVWPIKNFRKRLRRIQDGEMDDPLISEPFYTGTYGYKLSIWVYLNGRGKTLGDWVSVYARVMPSDHDNILNWPVRPMYTFTLLDQSEGEKEHIVRKRKVNDIKRDGGKHHHGIHRPEGGERSVIVGFDDFVAHAQLEKRKYVIEDCFYLKLEANIMC